MTAWILVLYVYAGSFAGPLMPTQIDGFSSQATCQVAGEQAKGLVRNTAKDYRFVCIQRK